MTKTTLLLAISIATSTVAIAGSPEARDSRELPKVTIGHSPTYIFDNTIYLSAQPNPQDFKIFNVLRVTTVIDLSGTADVHAIQSAGLDYRRVTRVEDSPSRLDAVMTALVNASREQRVLICDTDGERIGAVWALYRAIVHRIDAKQALAEGRSVGLTDPALTSKVHRIIGKNQQAVPVEP
jgi:hypothetical protein